MIVESFEFYKTESGLGDGYSLADYQRAYWLEKTGLEEGTNADLERAFLIQLLELSSSDLSLDDLRSQYVRPEPEPEPTPPEVVDTVFASTTGPALSQEITVPLAVLPGDVIVLVADSLKSTLVHTITGLSFTSMGTQTRGGLSTEVWTRTAVAGDSGTVVTATRNEELAGIVSILVLRNISSISLVGSLNQDVAPELLFPAFTPAPETLPLQILCVGSAVGTECVLTPATGITVVAQDVPGPTGRRSGIAFGINFTPDEAVGNVWTNTGEHFASTWLFELGI